VAGGGRGITAHEEKLLTLLWGPNIYEVPPYQRNYAWDSDQTGDFWAALLRTARGPEPYFLGSMVFVRTDKSAVFEVLDGQQRFASLSLVLAALRDVLKEGKPTSTYLSNIQATLATMDLSGKFGHAETVRLHLNERDDGYFESIARFGNLPDEKHTSHRLLKKAYLYFREQISAELAKSGSDAETLWNEIVDAFSERLYVIRIEVDDIVDAQMIFEALNSAGLDLTQADLIKNYLLRETPTAARSKAYKIWTSIADLVEEDSRLTTFIRTFWNSAYGFARKDQLYKKLRDRVKKQATTADTVDVQGFMKQIHQESNDWADLQAGAIVGPGVQVDDLNDDLRDLQTLGATLIYVPLLALRQAYRDDLVSFRKAVRWLRDFYVRHTIVGKRAANEVEELYTDWSLRIRKGKMNPDELHAELVRLSPSDSEFKESFSNLVVKTQKVARLLLARINDAADPANNITKTISSGGRVHLEHIVPQSPEKWTDLLEREDLDHERILWSIGNLTLLVGPRNIEISNSPFDVKQEKAYKIGQNIAPINKGLADAKEFVADTLKTRAEWLADQALGVWTLKK